MLRLVSVLNDLDIVIILHSQKANSLSTATKVDARLTKLIATEPISVKLSASILA